QMGLVSDIFMISRDTESSTSLWTLIGEPGVTSVNYSVFALTTASVSIPPSATQPATTVPLNTGDFRVQRAVWRGGRLWPAGNTGCLLSGDTAVRSCIRLLQVDTASHAVLQDFGFGAVGAYYFYPAIETD